MGEVCITVAAEEAVMDARSQARSLAATIGFDGIESTLIATAISELARNIVLYAGRGSIRLRPVTTDRTRGLTVIAHDDGPGIADVNLAMTDGYSTSGGLGLGLPGTRRLMDDFDVVSAPGKGTTVTTTKWMRPR